MHVHRLGVAPLKGASHPALASLRLDADGPVGDRVLCALDVERRTVLRTVAHPLLLAVEARLLDADRGVPGGWVLRTPGGEATGAVELADPVDVDYWGRRVVVRTLRPSPHAGLLAEHLGRDLRLATPPRGGVVYGGPVSVVTRATVRALADAAGLAEAEETTAARLRATVVLATDGDEPFTEESWGGRELVLGAARIRVRSPIIRCRVLDRHPRTGADLPRDRGVLRALGALRERPVAGVDAVVTQPGAVAVGDDARLV
ncbi:MOSC domain-containing protein [Nocardioides zeae]|uniref:MOSC domain-containing protein n=1 Tax=Nocardioides imazamoxiresistens TaxID=3231893 RepID=A0ABU3PUL9_9ACTN|nr:MOSC domain-containing protein [Nocardioides zeae]MDT9592596.1 MOSC domain-containing protein [Nocardioides zeae]